MTCTVDDCTKPTRTRTATLCEMHYFRLRRTGTTDDRLPGMAYKTVHANLLKQRGPAAAHICSHHSCNRQAYAWAFDWLSNPEYPRRDQNTGMIYTLNLDDYIPLCQPHHSRVDRRIRETLHQVELLLTAKPLTEDEEAIADTLIGHSELP